MGHIIALLLIATGLTAVQPAKAIPDADTRHDVISFAKDGWAPVPYELSHGVILLKATINGIPVKLEVDFGSNGVVSLNDPAWRRAIPAGAAIETGSHISADGVNRVEQRTKGELRVGSASVRDAPIDNGYTRTDKGDGLLGNGFLSKAGVIVDVQEKKLILIPQRANNAPPPRASGSTGA